MNGHATALLLLAASALPASFCALHLRSAVTRSATSRDQLAADLSEAERSLERLHETVALRRTADAPIMRFLAAWEPHFPGITSPDPLDEARRILQQLAQAQPVATSAWTTPPPVDLSVVGHRLRAQPVSLRAAGELERVLAWLGAAEQRLPSAKVTRAELTSFGNGVALDLTFLLPLEGGPQPRDVQRPVPTPSS